MKIQSLIRYLEEIAPLDLQESYDNSGLIIGDKQSPLTGTLICLDVTEKVLEEAQQNKCNLIIAHHPVLFRPLKKLIGESFVERIAIQAIQKRIAIYAIHTNLDNTLFQGVNSMIARKLNLTQTEILSPIQNLKKIRVYTQLKDVNTTAQIRNQVLRMKPIHHLEVRKNEEEDTLCLDITCPKSFQAKVISEIHRILPQGVNWIEVTNLESPNITAGAGLRGLLPEPMEEMTFLRYLKKQMKTDCIRHTPILGKPIQRVALCGGAGSFLLNQAIQSNADVFISGDFKYHEFFDADGQILVADIGHYESEQFTINLLGEIISKKFPTFAVHLAKTKTNPVSYL